MNEFLNNEDILDKEYISLLNDSNETQEIKNKMDKLSSIIKHLSQFYLLNFV
jgi:hypothetical protein